MTQLSFQEAWWHTEGRPGWGGEVDFNSDALMYIVRAGLAVRGGRDVVAHWDRKGVVNCTRSASVRMPYKRTSEPGA
eukprot:scaffold13928_cov29-Tisochrysis_lutea.AAC.4